jgi:hypothetical protein
MGRKKKEMADIVVLKSLDELKTRKDTLMGVLRTDRTGGLAAFDQLLDDIEATVRHYQDEITEIEDWALHFAENGSSARAGNTEYRTQIAEITGAEFQPRQRPTGRPTRRGGNRGNTERVSIRSRLSGR